MRKNWIFKKTDDLATTALARELNIHPSLASVLLQRGITNLDEAKKFFRPSLESLYDPFLMKDMLAAVEIILQSMQGGKKILVYGDYDVDGTTSVAMFYSFLKKNKAQVSYYIPNRHTEGYGVSKQGVAWAIERGISTIVTVDCGTRDIENVAFARGSGLNVIICDHHEPGERLPEASAILNPKQLHCNYPFKELSGCGVAFKLMQALATRLDISPRQLYPYIDLVALSTACDIVPLVDENRILVHHGLKSMQASRWPGLKSLLHASGVTNKSLAVSDLVFGLGPRINSAGRIDHAHVAVEALLARDREEVETRLPPLEAFNTLRKEIDKKITDEALSFIEDDPLSKNFKSTTLYNPTWHKGVIGIVASRCIEHHYKPTVILTESNGKAVGSARSVWRFNLFEAISKCSELLERYGGHAYAAGLTLSIENVQKFREKFEAIVASTISEESLFCPQIINAELPMADVDEKIFSVIERMGPFGPSNMQPIFLAKNVTISNYQILKGEHLKLYIKQRKGRVIEGIGFNLACHAGFLGKGIPCDILYSLEWNVFNREKQLSLRIRDLRTGGFNQLAGAYFFSCTLKSTAT